MAIRKKTFKGNANLKREGVQIEWTEETLSEYVKCSQDPIYFVKNYYTIVSIDKGKILFPPHPFQEDIINTVVDNRFTIVRVGRQSGKCVVADTTVTIKNRVTGVVEDIAIGEFHNRCLSSATISVTHEDLELPNSNDADSKKFIERVDTNNHDVLTDKGWAPLSQSNKTIQYDEWNVVLEDGNRITCADDHIFITKDMEEVFAKDCEGKYLNTAYGPQKVISASPNGSKSHMYDLTVDNDDHRYYTNDILSHNTTVAAAILLWYLLFKKDMSIAILAHKLAGAREILSRMQTAYEGLPFWLQQGVREWTKTSIVLENGSKAIASATTGSAVRGGSFNCVVGDTKITIEHKGGIYHTAIDTLSKDMSNKKVKKWYVYETTNTVNGKTYIGVHGSYNIKNDGYLGSGVALKRAVKKYGPESFTREILHTYDTLEEAELTEANIVNKDFVKCPTNYNISLGGNIPILYGEDNGFYGRKHTQKTKDRLREIHGVGVKINGKVYHGVKEATETLGLPKTTQSLINYLGSLDNSDRFVDDDKQTSAEHKVANTYLGLNVLSNNAKERFTGVEKTKEHKEKISNALKGRKSPWTILINKCPEKIRKTAEKHRGMKRSAAARKNMSEAAKGKVITDATKTKLSKALKGRKSPTTGRKLYHNPKSGENRFFLMDDVPMGWVAGQFKKK